jgi:hypothetical protein
MDGTDRYLWIAEQWMGDKVIRLSYSVGIMSMKVGERLESLSRLSTTQLDER